MNRSRPQNRRTNETALPWQSRVITAEQGASQAIPARSRVTEILRNEWLAIGAACGPFEWIALGYVAISSVLIAAFAENLAHPIRLLATRACVVALIILLCRGSEILGASESHLDT